MREEDYEIHKLEGSLSEVRNQLNEIDLNEQFIIFALDYGVGKTTFIENKIISGELPEGNFFSRRHDRIDETTKEFEDKGFNEYRHLYGFGYVKDNKALGCPKFLKNEHIKKLYPDCHLPPNLICQIVCKGRNCKYRKQFDDNKKWKLAPHEFLNVLNPKKFNIVDEDPTTFDTFEYLEDVNLELLSKYGKKEYEGSKYAIPLKKIDSAIKKATKDEAIEDIVELSKIRNNQLAFNSMLRSYIRPLDGTLYVPRIFNVFDYLRNDANVILLDGSFNLNLFEHFRDIYKFDIPNPIIYTSELKNKNTKVIRVNPHKEYFRGKKWDRFWDWDITYFSDPIRLIASLQGQGKKIGIITPKEIEEKFKLEGVIRSHYGDTSGTNAFVGCDALILLATHHWGYDKLSDFYQITFGIHPNEEKDNEVKRKGKQIARQVMDSISIEAGFRIRPLEHDVEIYFFRDIPAMFEEKFSCDKKELDELVEEPINDVNFSEIAKILSKAQYAKNRVELSNLTGYTGKKYDVIRMLCDYGIIKL